jgi:hypothetical protein
MLTFEMDSAAVSEKFDAMPAAVHGALAKKSEALRSMLEDKIKTQNLSGQVLNLRSGALKGTIISNIMDDGQSLGVSVQQSGEVKYGAIHEFGFNDQESVRAYLRTIRTAFGKAINPKEVMVKAFTRHMNMLERSFMRTALDDMKGEIRDGLAAAVQGSVSDL